MAIAIRDSVTVSMSEEMIGIGRRTAADSEVEVSASLGRISEKRVAKVTSSNVRAVGDWPRKKASAFR